MRGRRRVQQLPPHTDPKLPDSRRILPMPIWEAGRTEWLGNLGWVSFEAGQVSEYKLDRRHASFEASLCEAPQDDDLL